MFRISKMRRLKDGSRAKMFYRNTNGGEFILDETAATEYREFSAATQTAAFYNATVEVVEGE